MARFGAISSILVVPMMVTPDDYSAIPIMVVPAAMPTTIISTVIAIVAVAVAVAVAVVITVTTEPEPEFLRARYRRRSNRKGRYCGEYV
jgi:hypothetical protein